MLFVYRGCHAMIDTMGCKLDLYVLHKQALNVSVLTPSLGLTVKFFRRPFKSLSLRRTELTGVADTKFSR